MKTRETVGTSNSRHASGSPAACSGSTGADMYFDGLHQASSVSWERSPLRIPCLTYAEMVLVVPTKVEERMRSVMGRSCQARCAKYRAGSSESCRRCPCSFHSTYSSQPGYAWKSAWQFTPLGPHPQVPR